MKRSLLLVREGEAPRGIAPEVQVEDFTSLQSWLTPRLLGRLWRYRDATVRVVDLDHLPRPLLTALLLGLLTRGERRAVDAAGRSRSLSARAWPALLARCAVDALRRPGALRRIAREVGALRRADRPRPRLDPTRPPLYVFGDLALGLRSGGAVAHVTGVLNALAACGPPPLLLTTVAFPLLDPRVEVRRLPLRGEFLDFPGLARLWLNRAWADEADALLAGCSPGFVYQRNGMGGYLGVLVARARGLPLVLEYNGSEVWAGEHWSAHRLPHRELTLAVEELCLAAADLVVVVSEPLREELVGRGVDPAKVLVNPNGVDPERFGPHVEGDAVRRRLGLEGALVIGFIGSFGAWHGAEVLAEAFGRLRSEVPEALRGRLRLLMIGDGPRLPEVRARLARHGVGEAAILTGRVDQAEGPAHLAACDVLASPHVPNPDGSRFFGSPTKLFEYMAAGKGIVASDLEQIGAVLEHDRSAWLVPPGDVEALTGGLRALISDADLRARLGAAAREDALARHTWGGHTRRILEALAERCA